MNCVITIGHKMARYLDVQFTARATLLPRARLSTGGGNAVQAVDYGDPEAERLTDAQLHAIAARECLRTSTAETPDAQAALTIGPAPF
jgi:hypothetical protein